MIKRRFYKHEHGYGSGASASSSSDSASESDSVQESDEEENFHVEKPQSPSSGSGYQSEDSSGNEIEGDSAGLPLAEEDNTERGENPDESMLVRAEERDEKITNVADKAFDSNDPIQAELTNCILKCKSVYKCRLCPRIVCLSEDTVRTHLSSKRHARSKKLLEEGRLKLILNSDGEIEEDQETHAERHARTLALAQQLDASPRKDKKLPPKNQRRRKHNASVNGKTTKRKKSQGKRRRRNED